MSTVWKGRHCLFQWWKQKGGETDAESSQLNSVQWSSPSQLDSVPSVQLTPVRAPGSMLLGRQGYSPVARWMADVDVALNDEIWCGDHKRTPGGLRKSEEARAFRRKLMRRPIALRGDTKFIPPHMLGVIVLPYVQGVPGPQVAGLRQLLQQNTRQPLDLSYTSVTALQELCQETIGRCWDAAVTPCCCAAIAVLWLALSPEKFPLQADTFCIAVGPDLAQQCESVRAYLRHYCWHQISGAGFFFWTMLRSSLQLWQSWSCAKVVIVRQLDQKKGQEPTKQSKQKKNKPQNNNTNTKPTTVKFLTNRWKGETRWNWLTLSLPLSRKNPGSHNVFSIL